MARSTSIERIDLLGNTISHIHEVTLHYPRSCFVSGTLSGCISEEETERRFIDDDSELLDAEDAGVCGDLDGDGEMDCPLSGYIPDTMPWWCNSTGK